MTTEEELDAYARQLRTKLEYLLLAEDLIYPKPPERQAIVSNMIAQHIKQPVMGLHPGKAHKTTSDVKGAHTP